MPEAATQQGGEKTPRQALEELHGADQVENGVILVVDGDNKTRNILQKILQSIFADTDDNVALDEGTPVEIAAFVSRNEAVSAASDELKGRILAVIANGKPPADGVGLIDALMSPLASDAANADDSAPSSRNPILNVKKTLFILTGRKVDSKNNQVREWIEKGLIQGVLQRPYDSDALKTLLLNGIAQRREFFEQIETLTKTRVLKSFIKRHLEVADLWQKKLQSLYNSDRRLKLEDKNLKDLKSMIDAARATTSDLNRLNNESFTLQYFSHEISNNLTVLTSLSSFLLDDIGPSSSAWLVLQKVEREAWALAAEVNILRHTYSEGKSWATVEREIAKEPEIQQDEFKTENVSGLNICVVDDVDGIKKALSEEIERKDGTAFSAGGAEELALLANRQINVVLLDHNLKKNKFGYQLIDKIRQQWPQAVIICHTGDAALLKRDSENPYTAAGIEIVDKMDFCALNEVFRRKFHGEI